MRTESGSLIKPIIPQEVAPTSQAAKLRAWFVDAEPAAQMPAVNTDNPFREGGAKDRQPKLTSRFRRGGQANLQTEWEDQKVRDAVL
jgi:hypothetical protein